MDDAPSARELYSMSFDNQPGCPWERLPAEAKARWERIAKERPARLAAARAARGAQ